MPAGAGRATPTTAAPCSFLVGRFCEDVVSDILSRLPIKSVVRFRALNKYFRETVSDPRFAANHALQSNAPEVHGLFQFSQTNPKKILFFSLPHADDSRLISNSTGTATCGDDKDFMYLSPIVASCNGLLLLYLSESDLCVFNPTTDQFKVIQQSQSQSLVLSLTGKWHLGLAYDPICFSSLHYRVVQVYRVRSPAPGLEFCCFDVFNSSNNSWRRCGPKLPCPVSEFLTLRTQAVYLDGVLHWLRARGDIVTFDVEKEMADIITLPIKLRMEWSAHAHRSWFGAAKGFIYVVYVLVSGEIMMWVLHDYKYKKWGLVRNQIKDLEGAGGGHGNNNIIIPIFFDGERLVFESDQHGRRVIQMYNMKLEKWSKVGMVPTSGSGILRGGANAYTSFIPILAPVQPGASASPSTSTATTSNGDHDDPASAAYETFQRKILRKNECKKRKQSQVITSDYQLRSKFKKGERLETTSST